MKKLDKIFLSLHEFHNFRESHINSCKRCKAYFNLYDLLKEDEKINQQKTRG
jgi:hypothetical protein